MKTICNLACGLQDYTFFFNKKFLIPKNTTYNFDLFERNGILSFKNFIHFINHLHKVRNDVT